VVDAKKQRYDREAALVLLAGVDTLLVAKGPKVTRVDLKSERPDDDTIVALMLGPTGNLRAPTLRVGRAMLVGFNPDMYAETVG
jgi:arsenate reductase-like glutaredoxin family protein